MAKILSINDEKISVGQDDGKLIEVPVSELSFVPSIGQEVDVFVGSDKVIVNPTENAKAKNTSKGSSKKIYHKWYFGVIVIVIVNVIVGVIGIAVTVGTSDTNSNSQSIATTAKVGEKFNVGKVNFEVNSIDFTDAITDTYDDEVTPRGSLHEFIIVNVTIRNNSDEPIYLESDLFKLKSGRKTFAPADYNAQTAANRDSDFSDFSYETINPDDEITGNVVFEASLKVLLDKKLQMQVQTEFEGTQIGLVYLYDK